MTDTIRPEWMPDLLDVQEQSDLHLGWADDEAMDFIYHVGLRAQIAVLEEMVPMVCPDCAAGAEDDGSFNHWQGRRVSEDNWEQEQFECRASILREKLFSLRKELSQ